jgi:phosphohistidine phosphatase
MKTLSLLRHAKSSWGDAALADFDRPLNARGVKAARAMGAELSRLGIGFDRVIASPAARVVGTIAELAEGGCALAPDYDRRIYLASTRQLLEIVRAADDADRLLLIGHNPGMAELALLLSRAGPLREEVSGKYPTGALAELSFEIESWRDLAPGAGRLARFIRPRDLALD